MKKVLVIEDDQITRNLHTRVLEEPGYSVMTASNGPDGIATALREKPVEPEDLRTTARILMDDF